MDIHQTLLKEHSTAIRNHVVTYIGHDKQRFAVLMEAFFDDGYRLSQRAAFSVGYIAEKNPEMIFPYLDKMIANLKKPVHDAVKRNTVRTLQYLSLPEHLWGEAFDTCFRLLQSTSEPVAIKVFSMSVLLNIVKKVPDLKEELRITIEDQMPYGSPGFLSRGKKVLKALEKL